MWIASLERCSANLVFHSIYVSCYSNWPVRVTSQCARALPLPWLTCGRAVRSSQMERHYAWPLFNHVPRALADKRCKGDYGSRRTSLRSGGPWDYVASTDFWLEHISIQMVASSRGGGGVGGAVTGKIGKVEKRLTREEELELNGRGLCLICELIPLWWVQQMTVYVLIAF